MPQSALSLLLVCLLWSARFMGQSAGDVPRNPTTRPTVDQTLMATQLEEAQLAVFTARAIQLLGETQAYLAYGLSSDMDTALRRHAIRLLQASLHPNFSLKIGKASYGRDMLMAQALQQHAVKGEIPSEPSPKISWLGRWQPIREGGYKRIAQLDQAITWGGKQYEVEEVVFCLIRFSQAVWG